MQPHQQRPKEQTIFWPLCPGIQSHPLPYEVTMRSRHFYLTSVTGFPDNTGGQNKAFFHLQLARGLLLFNGQGPK